jgi:hypothetical protein
MTGVWTRRPVSRVLCRPDREARTRRPFLWTAPRGTVLATYPGCSWRGLPCRRRCRRRGALLPHPFTLAGRGPESGPAVCFLWRYPWGRPRRALPAAMSSWSPDFPRAPKRPRPPGRLVRAESGGRRDRGQPRGANWSFRRLPASSPAGRRRPGAPFASPPRRGDGQGQRRAGLEDRQFVGVHPAPVRALPRFQQEQNAGGMGAPPACAGALRQVSRYQPPSGCGASLSAAIIAAASCAPPDTIRPPVAEARSAAPGSRRRRRRPPAPAASVAGTPAPPWPSAARTRRRARSRSPAG